MTQESSGDGDTGGVCMGRARAIWKGTEVKSWSLGHQTATESTLAWTPSTAGGALASK